MLMMGDKLPQWYLDESTPRLKRLGELSPIAYPNKIPQDIEGRKKMYLAREEWDRLMAEQSEAEVNAGL